MHNEDIRRFVINRLAQLSATHALFDYLNRVVSAGHYNNELMNMLVERIKGWHTVSPNEPFESVVNFWLSYTIMELAQHPQASDLNQTLSHDPNYSQWVQIYNTGLERRNHLNYQLQQQQRTYAMPQQSGAGMFGSGQVGMGGGIPGMGSAVHMGANPIATMAMGTTQPQSNAAAVTGFGDQAAQVQVEPVSQVPAAHISVVPATMTPQPMMVHSTVPVHRNGEWYNTNGARIPESIDISSTRPYDRFVKDNNLWEVAHVSNFRLPVGKIPQLVDYNQHIPYMVVNPNGEVIEGFLAVNIENEYLKNELVMDYQSKPLESKRPTNKIVESILSSRKQKVVRKEPTNLVIKDKEINLMVDRIVAVTPDTIHAGFASLRDAVNSLRLKAAITNESSGYMHVLIDDLVFYRGDAVDIASLPVAPAQLAEILASKRKAGTDLGVINALDRRLTTEINELLAEISAGFQIESFISDIADALNAYRDTVPGDSPVTFSVFRNLCNMAVSVAMQNQTYTDGNSQIDEAIELIKDQIPDANTDSVRTNLLRMYDATAVIYLDRDMSDLCPNLSMSRPVGISEESLKKMSPDQQKILGALIDTSKQLAADHVKLHVAFSDGRIMRVSMYCMHSDHVTLTEVV